MATFATAAYPAPYQQQPPHPRNYVPRPPPPNWVPPPFNGPPPIPTGITVNPQQWQAGFWKPNPAWNGARPNAQQQQQQQQQPQQQHTLWIPSQHWHQPKKQQQPAARPQQQQAASFNPYKRVIHPPSAEYLATKLSDNPLGLIDMKPATIEEYYKQGQPVEEQHTPWIWNPAHLEDEDDDSTSPSRRSSEPESFTSQLELKPTFSPSIVRTPQHYRDTPSPTARRPSRASIDSALSAQMANLSTKPSLARNSTMPSLSSASSFDSDLKPPPTSSMFLSTQLFDEPDSMLSPLIIANTPKPLPPHSLNRVNGVRNNHPNPILATQSLDTIPEAPPSHYRVAAHESTHATPKPRPRDVGPSPPHVNNLPTTSPTHAYQQAQVPSLPRSQTDWQEVKKQREREQEYREREQERVEREQRKQQREQREREQREQREREQREREQHDRDVQERERIERERREQRSGIGSRHTLTAYVDPYVNASTKHSPPYSARPSPTSGSAHPSPTHYTPPRQVQVQTTPPSATSLATTTAPRTTNPLPPPPEPSTRVPLTTTPAPTSASTPDTPSKTRATTESYHPPPQGPEPASYIYKTRHGYWNRRGDHLTPTGYLVYAPPHLANPPDLRIYPPENEGYMDHNGLYTTWCQRPELPASLPRMGKEPELPYEKFVVWVYQ